MSEITHTGGHTPGPWSITRPWMGFSSIHGPNGELIFGLAAGSPDEKRPDNECEANAHLIATAPDGLRLAYLIKRLARSEELSTHVEITFEPHDAALILNAAEALIAKATAQDPTPTIPRRGEG